MIRRSQREIVHPYGEKAKSVGLRLGEPLGVSHGINYSPLTASDHRCKEELCIRFTLRPLPNACKLEGDLWKLFWAMVVAAGG